MASYGGWYRRPPQSEQKQYTPTSEVGIPLLQALLACVASFVVLMFPPVFVTWVAGWSAIVITLPEGRAFGWIWWYERTLLDLPINLGWCLKAAFSLAVTAGFSLLLYRFTHEVFDPWWPAPYAQRQVAEEGQGKVEVVSKQQNTEARPKNFKPAIPLRGMGKKLAGLVKKKKHKTRVVQEYSSAPMVHQTGWPKYLLGYNYSSNVSPVFISLSGEGGSIHTLIAGSTGSGKSNLLAGLIIQLRADLTPIHVIDLKGSLRKFEAEVESFADNLSDAKVVLNSLYDEMQMRNLTGENDIPVVLVIDELADLVATGNRETSRGMLHLLTNLARKAREANISLIAATQYPKANVVDSSFTRNLLQKVCMTCDTKTQASVILGGLSETVKRLGLPRRVGEFIIRHVPRGWEKGTTLEVRGVEVERETSATVAHDDHVYMRVLEAFHRKPRGTDRLAREEDLKQTDVRDAYDTMREAGIMSPAKRGRTSQLLCGYDECRRRLEGALTNATS